MAYDVRNGKTPMDPKYYRSRDEQMPSDSSNLEAYVKGKVKDILGVESPISLNRIHKIFGEIYRPDNGKSSVLRETIDSVIETGINNKDYVRTKALNDSNSILWDVSKYGNYDQFRHYHGKKRDDDLGSISVKELENALIWCYVPDKKDDDIIHEALEALGYDDCGDFGSKIRGLFKDVKSKINYNPSEEKKKSQPEKSKAEKPKPSGSGEIGDGSQPEKQKAEKQKAEKQKAEKQKAEKPKAEKPKSEKPGDEPLLPFLIGTM